MKRNNLLLIMLFCFVGYVRADWPIGKKRVTVSLSYNYSRTTSYFDSLGLVRNSLNGSVYASQGFGFMAATGLTRRLDAYTSFPLSIIHSSNIYVNESKTGIGDVVMGLAFHTPTEDLKRYFTMKFQLMIPSYSNTKTPYLGYGSKGALIGANYSFSLRKNQFTIIEGTLARYFDYSDGPTQYGINLAYGFELPRYQSLTFNFNHLTSSSSNKLFSTDLNANKDFMFGRLGAAFGKRITRTLTMFLTGSYSIYGKNTGRGGSATLTATVKLP